MNVYQLVPTSCYDDDDGGNVEVWDPETERPGAAAAEDGRASRNGFYVDPAGDSGSEAIGWYNIVDGDGSHAASVPPVPRLLAFADQHLRFFDDDESSAENETFFGRTLDTISEEDEDDDVMARDTATGAEADAKQHRCSTYDHLYYLSFHSHCHCFTAG